MNFEKEDFMLDKGKTSDYTMVYLDMMFQSIHYLSALDQESELGKALHELSLSISRQCPNVLIYNEMEDTPPTN